MEEKPLVLTDEVKPEVPPKRDTNQTLSPAVRKIVVENNIDISKKTYIATESYRNDKELFNLQCWALTAESFFSSKEWEWILKKNKYFREYELIYFS